MTQGLLFERPSRRFQDGLEAGRFVITAEVTPPVSCDPDDLLRKAAPLRGLADAVNVTDGASARVHMSAPIAAALLARAGIEPILQLTCRDRNRIALQAELLGANAAGVRNLLLLTGDDPKAGDQPDAKGVFDLDSAQLTATAQRMRARGELPSGRAIAGRPDFFLGTPDLPLDPAPDWRPTRLQAKIDAGAQFAQTQFCMDAALVRRYAARLADAGIFERLYLLIGVAPLRSARSVRWMRAHLFGVIISETILARMEQASDEPAEGRKICIELLQELAEIKGIAGAHIMAPGNETAIPDVVETARATIRRTATA